MPADEPRDRRHRSRLGPLAGLLAALVVALVLAILFVTFLILPILILMAFYLVLAMWDRLRRRREPEDDLG